MSSYVVVNKIGGSPSDLYLGGSQVRRMYLGDTMIWDRANSDSDSYITYIHSVKYDTYFENIKNNYGDSNYYNRIISHIYTTNWGKVVINTYDVTSMWAWFANFGTSTNDTLNLTHLYTSKVTNMSQMFYYYYCSTLDISNLDTSKVTDMSQMFYHASRLTELDLSSFDTSNVTDMSEMFQNCVSLTELDLSTFNTLRVTNMDNFFSIDGSSTSSDDYQITKLVLSSKFFNASTTKVKEYDFRALVKWTDTDSLATLVSVLPQGNNRTLRLSSQTYNTLTKTQRTTITNKGWTLTTSA